jgi:hypothetical protein
MDALLSDIASAICIVAARSGSWLLNRCTMQV